MIATAVIAPDRTLPFLFPGTALPLFLFSFFFYEGDSGCALFLLLYGVNQPLLFLCPSTPLAFPLGSATSCTAFLHTGVKKVQTFCHGDGGRQIPLNVGPDCCAPAKRCSAVPGGPREETRLPQNEITKLPQCNV